MTATPLNAEVAAPQAAAATSSGDWFSQHLADVGVQDLARADYTSHHTLTRSDMLGLFAQVEREGGVSSAAFSSLVQITENESALQMTSYVSDLTNKVVDGNYANRFAGDGISSTGNLVAGAKAAGLEALVDDWFYGEGPLTGVGTGMSYVSGQLFGASGPKFTDVKQGDLGDCSLMSSLAEVAARVPQDIENMFINNGDGTYGVRFFDNGVATYVTVNTALPEGGNLYDQPQGGVLWVALAEKAVVELNESGWLATGTPGSNSYLALGTGSTSIETGYLKALTDYPATAYTINPSNIAAAWNAGDLVVLNSTANGDPGYIVGAHAYALVEYNGASAYPFTVFNPWGVNGGTESNGIHFPGEVSLNGAAVSAYFSWDSIVSAAPDVAGVNATPAISANAVAAAVSALAAPKSEDRPAANLLTAVAPETTSAARELALIAWGDDLEASNG